LNEFPSLALHIARKDWRESRRLLALLTAGLIAPALLARFPGEGSRDFAIGLLAGLLAGTGFGYAQYCFLSERQRGTLDTLLSLPVRPHEIVLAKYCSLYSMVLFTVNVPMLLVPDLKLVFVTNSAALFLATLFMASTVVSARPWAFQIPVWGLLLFVLPTERILERYYPVGLEPFRAVLAHPLRLSLAALLLVPILVGLSTLIFSVRISRD
jgi:ABC-type Na+ efflux pump permease subunit